jgi:hypothetical protein
MFIFFWFSKNRNAEVGGMAKKLSKDVFKK